MREARDSTKQQEDDAPPRPRAVRRRRKQFTDTTYGARLPHEDARIADYYARDHRLDRADVVRLAMHQFALRQQMRYKPKDPLREMQEHVFKEHFAPVTSHLEAITATLAELMQAFSGLRANATSPLDEPRNGDDLNAQDAGEVTGSGTGLLEQKRLLESILVASTLALRLHVNYLVEPQLRHLDAGDAATLEPHLRLAAQGKTGWCAPTREVVKRTGEQVLRELNLLPADAPDDTTAEIRSEGARRHDALTAEEIAATL